ncbi:MAG: T9SS type A sorting domain-containing protein [Candidatus Cloacimonetes bacterium]|nr:T9SS type A sorting domain-containing protein [Candidatus Cloacimonadota bacterium]
MKFRIRQILLISGLIGVTLFDSALAQRIVKVDPGYGTLNAAVQNDEATQQISELNNTIYQLKRGGYYITSGTIENVGYELNIQAEEGKGARPIVRPGVDQGGLSTNSFSPRGNLTLKGLYVLNVDLLGQLLPNTIDGRSDSIRITLDDCHFDSTANCFIYMSVDWLKIYMTNCVFSNSIGNYHDTRVYDTAKNNVDTVLVQNCTIYNIGGYCSRGANSGGALNYIKWDHNTFYNIGRGFGTVGQTIDTYFTNNLCINSALLGKDSLGAYFPDRVFDNTFYFKIVALNNLYAIGRTQTFYLHHNNFFTDDDYRNYPFPQGVTYPLPYFENYGRKMYEKYNTGEFWFEKRIAFTNPPPIDVGYITRLWYDNDDDRDGRLGNLIPAEFSNEGAPFDFSYSTENFSYTAAENGYPLGDLNWFPDKKAKWEAGEILTSLNEETSSFPQKIEFFQNYPNPFNPSTIITFSLAERSNVHLTIYDVLGREITKLLNGSSLNRGIHEIKWDATTMNGSKRTSNILFARLQADEIFITKKIVMVK